MSEFTPLPKNNPDVTSSANAQPDLSAQGMVENAKNPNARALGWSLSIGLHVLACSLLLTGLSSALHLNTLPGSAEMAADPASAQARQQVQQLLQTQQELERIQASTQTKYAHWLRTQASHAAANIQQAVRTAGEAHTQTAQALQQADAAQNAIAQAREALTTAEGQSARTRALNSLQQAQDEFAKAQDVAQRAQERAGEAYAEANRNIEFLPEGSGDIQAARQAVAAAVAAYTQARDAQSRAAVALNALQSQENGLAETVKTMTEGPKQTANAQKAQAVAQQQAEQAGRAAQQMSAIAAQASSQAALATAREAQTHTPADSQSARKAQQESASLNARALKAQQEAQNLQAQAQAAQNATAKAMQSTAQQQNDLQQKLKAGEQAAQQLAQAQRAAAQAQAQSQQQHTAAARAVRQLRTTSQQPAGESADSTVENTQDSAAFDAKHRNSLPSFESLNSQDLAQLYDTATRAEAANLLAAQQIQARAASMAQTIPLQQALDATDATPPVRPQLGNQGHPGMALFSSASTMTTQQREEARQQIASMTALAQQMLNRAQPTENALNSAKSKGSSSLGTPVGTAAMAANTTPSARQIALATEDDGRPAKDLTGTAFSPPGLPGQEKTHASKADHSEKMPLPQGADVPKSPLEAPPPSPPVEIKALPGRIVGKDINGRGLAAKNLIGEKGLREKGTEGSGVTGADWMYVDSWYTIGPFPNPQRQNIHKPFPPESGVDLDAVYVGKDNRTVRWQWIQTGKPELVPNIPEEYAIYYGYTELWFEEPADLWIALGSDDKSTLWIEDQLVWVSSDILKGWRINEGLRKVHFKQGRNRVLFRLENGWLGVGFSLCLCLKPNPH